MDETEWLRGAAPVRMLQFLQDRVSERKLQLFAVACCRAVWEVFRDDTSRTAILVAERYAEGLASEEERSAARSACVHRAAAWACANRRNVAKAAELCLTHIKDDAVGLLRAQAVSGPLAEELTLARARGPLTPHRTLHCWQDFQRKLLRDVAGNPFRPVCVDPRWRTPDVLAMARAIYHEETFERFPYLWDALEEAGCDDPLIRRHLTEPALHVRGCWLVDLLLGRH